MLHLLPSKPNSEPAPDRVTPGRRQRDRLREQIQAQQSQLERLIREKHMLAPDLAARARSVLLYLTGMSPQEIASATGMTSNAVMRVRRRYAAWGLPCLAEPEPRTHPGRTNSPHPHETEVE